MHHERPAPASTNQQQHRPGVIMQSFLELLLGPHKSCSAFVLFPHTKGVNEVL